MGRSDYNRNGGKVRAEAVVIKCVHITAFYFKIIKGLKFLINLPSLTIVPAI